MAHDRRLAISSLLVADSVQPDNAPDSPPQAPDSLAKTSPPPEQSDDPSESSGPSQQASLLYSAPPVRAAAKRGRAFAFTPVLTSTQRKKPSTPKDASDPADATPSSSRRKPNTARARPRPKVAATSDRKASSQKKSLLVQAQENRARIVQAQAAQEKATADNAAPKDEEREYCVCKSRYDEERAMIGCDRCDEWYHPLCVGLEDSDVDQIDLYVCPACRKQNPHLQITRKILCGRRGCEKVSRRQASKYCSDECGTLAMKMLIDEKGVDSNALWKAVKDVQKPEGKVISTDGEFISQKEAYAARQQYEISVLQAKLDVIGEERKQLLDVFEPSRLRSRLIGKAAERAAETDSCGWDTRLLWSDADWLIKSDEDETWEGYDGIPVTEGNTWWCPENSACERHEGWQDLLVQEFDKEQQIHDTALERLVERERELRLRIDAVTNPKARARLMESLENSSRDFPLQDDGRVEGGRSRKEKTESSSKNKKKR